MQRENTIKWNEETEKCKNLIETLENTATRLNGQSSELHEAQYHIISYNNYVFDSNKRVGIRS